MTTGATGQLGLALPVQGELSGTWGDTVNNGITQYTNLAIAATLTLTNDGAVTLANTTGDASATNITSSLTGVGTVTAQHAIVKVTGTLTTTKVVTFGSSGSAPYSKTFLVVNAATGGSVSFTAYGGSGVTIAAGESAYVYFDGTNIVKVVGAVSGILPVASGGTGASSLTANNVILGNGTSAVQVVAPGTAGNVLTSVGGTWASAVLPAGGLTYVVKTSNYTTQDKEGVLADTTAGAFTVTLPASPSTGAQVVVADSAGTWGTNNLTVGRNGSTIAGSASDLVCDISGVAVQLVYNGTTWDVYAQVGGNGGTAVTETGTQTLTNKTISADSNTLSGIAASSFVVSNASGYIDGSAAQKVIPSGVVVGTSDSQTLTNKTIQSGIYSEAYAALSGTTPAVDCSTGNVFSLTTSGNTTFTFTNVPTTGIGYGFTLKLTAGGTHTLTWPASVDWPGGAAPSAPASGATNVYVFITYDGGTIWYGFLGGAALA